MPKRSAGKGDSPGVAVPSDILDQVFGALAHPSRRQILVILFARGGSMSAGEIADRFQCSWPTTTRHLGVLEKAGLLEVEKSGRNRIYRLQQRWLLRAADWIESWAAPLEGDVPSSVPDDVAGSYATMRNAMPPGKKKSRRRPS